MLERVAISFTRGSPDPGIEAVSLESAALAGGFFITKPPGKPINVLDQCIFQSGDLPFD